LRETVNIIQAKNSIINQYLGDLGSFAPLRETLNTLHAKKKHSNNISFTYSKVY